MVQITFEAEEGTFLMSDFDMRCRVLASDYLAMNEIEWDAFYDKSPLPVQKDVEAT